MKTKFLQIFAICLLMMTANNSFGQWVVLDGSTLPHEADPAWAAPDGVNGFTTVVDDPDIPGNKLLKIVDETESNKELWRLDWNITDADQGVTVVFRTKMADELLDFWQTTAKDDKIFFISPRNGAYTEAVAYYYPDSLSINQNGSYFKVDYTDWTVFRLNMKGDSVNLYVGENPTPLYSGLTPNAKADNYLSFGNNAKEPYGGYFDWIAWDLSGAYAPSDGSALPGTLTGLPDSYTVTFNVTDGTDPLAGAAVEFNGSLKNTDANGDAIFINVLPGSGLEYSVKLNGYDDASGTVDVTDADVAVPVTLNPVLVTYNVTFIVTDGTSPLEGANVTFLSVSQLTDANGETVFTEIGAGSGLAYTVTLDGYEDVNGTVNITDADVTENVTMVLIPPTYSVTFNVSDGTNPLTGAVVAFNSTTETTDASGKAVFEEVSPGAGLAFTVTLPGYNNYSGTLDVVDADVSMDVTLIVAENNWTVYNGSELLENAFLGWIKDRTTAGVTDGASSVLYSVVDDPDISGNKLLKCEDLSVGTRESWQLEWQVMNPETGLTIVMRVKPTEDILEYAPTVETSFTKFFYISPRNGAFKDAVVFYYPDSLIFTNAGEHLKYTQTGWSIFRMTLKGNAMDLYINENPDPVLSNADLVTATDIRVLFGNNTNEPYGSYVDWMIWDLTGAFAPGEGSQIPGDLSLDYDGENTIGAQIIEAEPLRIYPNPASDNTKIIYNVRKTSATSLEIFDITGKQITNLVNEVRQPGTYEIDLDTGGLPSGMYFCRFRSGDKVIISKLIKN